LIDLLDSNPLIAAAGPRVLNSDLSLQSKGFLFPSITHELIGLFRVPKFFKQSQLYRFFSNYYWDEFIARPVDWISGCCMLLRKETVNKIGGLSEDFFMYHEDEEWCYRAHMHGYSIWYYPDVSVTHQNFGSPSDRRELIMRHSSKLFYRKTIGIWKASIIYSIGILNSLSSLILSMLRLDFMKVRIYMRMIRETTSYICYLNGRKDL